MDVSQLYKGKLVWCYHVGPYEHTGETNLATCRQYKVISWDKCAHTYAVKLESIDLYPYQRSLETGFFGEDAPIKIGKDVRDLMEEPPPDADTSPPPNPRAVEWFKKHLGEIQDNRQDKNITAEVLSDIANGRRPPPKSGDYKWDPRRDTFIYAPRGIAVEDRLNDALGLI